MTMKRQSVYMLKYLIVWIAIYCLMIAWGNNLDVIMAFLLGAIFGALFLIWYPFKLKVKFQALLEALGIAVIVYTIGSVPLDIACRKNYQLQACLNENLDYGFPIFMFTVSAFGILVTMISLYFSLQNNLE